MPALSGSDLHNPVPVCFAQQAHAHDFHLEHHGRHVTRQHHIAATAQHKHRLAPPQGVTQKLANVILATDAHQGFGTRSNAKGIAMLQGNIFLD